MLEMYKTKHAPKNIDKLLKVKRMLVCFFWVEGIKNLIKTKGVMNRQGYSHPWTQELDKFTWEKLRRNPKRSLRNLAKEANVSIWTMSIIFHEDLKTFYYKPQKKLLLSETFVEKQQVRCQVIPECIWADTLLSLVFSNEKWFKV